MSPARLGVFTPAEQRILIAALMPNAAPDEQRRILDFCAEHCARGTPESNKRFAARQRQCSAAARQIERLANRIIDIDEKTNLREGIIQDAKAIIEKVRRYKLVGRPHRSIFRGAHRLAIWHLNATGKPALSRSRSSAFADVLRIVYRVVDPLPIIDEIIQLGDSEMIRRHLHLLRKAPGK